MILRPVDNNGDILPVLSSADLLRDVLAVARLVKDRLEMLSGDWWENLTWGNRHDGRGFPAVPAGEAGSVDLGRHQRKSPGRAFRAAGGYGNGSLQWNGIGQPGGNGPGTGACPGGNKNNFLIAVTQIEDLDGCKVGSVRRAKARTLPQQFIIQNSQLSIMSDGQIRR